MQTTQGETKWQQIIGDDIDGLIDVFAPPNVVNQFPDHAIVKILRADHGTALYFQHSDPVFQDRRVRKAFCYLIDSEQVAENSGSGSQVKGHIEHNTGILKSRREKYLSDVIDGFEKYAPEVDKSKATSLLEDAGFTKRNGTWETPEGEALEVPIKTFVGGGDRTSATQTIVSNLQEFGIQAEMQTYEATTFFGKTLPNGNYRLALDAWGGFKFYPYFSFYSNFSRPSQLQSYNYPASEVEVPMPVGDLQGSLETIDAQKLVVDLSQTDAGSEEEMTLIQKLAWIWNQTVPAFAFEVTRDQTILTNDDWNIPSEDSETMDIRRPIEVLTRPAIRETIAAKTE
jgi:peptide/nickel transport system substrate-binding protein